MRLISELLLISKLRLISELQFDQKGLRMTFTAIV